MSDRPFQIISKIHGFETRVGLTMPCPWPACNRSVGDQWRRPTRLSYDSPRADEWDESESETNRISVDNVVYERRAMMNAGDGMRSTLWTWVRRS